MSRPFTSRGYDLTNRVIDRLTVKHPVGKNKTGAVQWLCTCSCGNVVTRTTSNLLRKDWHQSCGCLKTELLTKHGQNTKSKGTTPEYMAWQAMKSRCQPEHKQHADYSDRGIKVCSHWVDSFETFFAALGKKPSSKHSLDRKDNDLGYLCNLCSPPGGNCHWVTPKQQAANRRIKRLEHFSTKALLNELSSRVSRVSRRHRS